MITIRTIFNGSRESHSGPFVALHVSNNGALHVRKGVKHKNTTSKNKKCCQSMSWTKHFWTQNLASAILFRFIIWCFLSSCSCCQFLLSPHMLGGGGLCWKIGGFGNNKQWRLMTHARLKSWFFLSNSFCCWLVVRLKCYSASATVVHNNNNKHWEHTKMFYLVKTYWLSSIFFYFFSKEFLFFASFFVLVVVVCSFLFIFYFQLPIKSNISNYTIK